MISKVRSFQVSNVNVSVFSLEFGYYNYNPDKLQIKVFLNHFIIKRTVQNKG